MTDRTAKRRARSRRPRTAARLAAVQALYQIEMSALPPSRVIEEFVVHRLDGQRPIASAQGGASAQSGASARGGTPGEDEGDPESDDPGYGPADVAHFRRVVGGAAGDLETIDAMIAAALPRDWPIDRLDSTLRALLRVAVWELLGCSDVPAAVAISEYVDISHAFHGDRAPALVNGALDSIARRLREGELDRGTERGGS